MRIPSVMMRGGTSRALFFRDEDLPVDRATRTSVLLAAFGSPDPFGRQIDGVGGATSSTSKAAIIRKSTKPGIDVEYKFGQVAVDRPLVDFSGSCGNIASAVGPYSVDEGLVPPHDPTTLVRILATNTNKVIVAHVPTLNGRFNPAGDFEIPGISGCASRIDLDFLDPGGSLTGKLLPTGNPRDTVRPTGQPAAEVSIVDAAHPNVFVRFEEVGLTGAEDPAVLDADLPLMRRLEAIRAFAGELAGLGDADHVTRSMPATPRLALVGSKRPYRRQDGVQADPSEFDLVAQGISMGRVHRAYPLTGAICTAVAAAIPGTVVHDVIHAQPGAPGQVRIGHPSGTIHLSAQVAAQGPTWQATSVRAGRTARRLMEGFVLVPYQLQPSR